MLARAFTESAFARSPMYTGVATISFAIDGVHASGYPMIGKYRGDVISSVSFSSVHPLP
jgi:hypothetical protein